MVTEQSEQAPRPDPIADMIAATNSEDREAFIGSFSAEAVVDDFGRSFAGRDEIQGWSDRENIGTHNRIEVTKRTSNEDSEVLKVQVTGKGYNGSGTFAILLKDGLIARLVIRA